jgi:hypothetical protein
MGSLHCTNSEIKSLFEINLSVSYNTPVLFDDPDGKALWAAGYFRKFVVVASSEQQALQLISKEVEDGQIDWKDTDVKLMTALDLAEYSLEHENDLKEPGIIFRSSHFLY